MLPRSGQLVEHLIPILHWLAIQFHNHMPYNRRADSFVRNGKVNVGTVAAVELQDWPYRRTHLLTLHVGGVTGNTESQESNKRRDDRVIPTGAAPLVFPPARRGAYRRRSKCQSGDELPVHRL